MTTPPDTPVPSETTPWLLDQEQWPEHPPVTDRSEKLPRRFRRKPQVIEAIQYRPDIPNCGDIARFTGLIPPDGAWECDEEPHDDQPWHLTMAVSAFIGDWVVKYGEDDFGVLRNGQLLANWEPCDE